MSAEAYLWTCSTLNLKAEGLQQEKTTSGMFPKVKTETDTI